MDKAKPGSPGAQGEPSAQDTGSTNGQDELAMRLSDLARDLQRQEDPHDTLLGVVRAAVELIPGVEEGSISVVLGRREIRSEVPSGELPRAVDAVQNEVGQGPALTRRSSSRRCG